MQATYSKSSFEQSYEHTWNRTDSIETLSYLYSPGFAFWAQLFWAYKILHMKLRTSCKCFNLAILVKITVTREGEIIKVQIVADC